MRNQKGQFIKGNASWSRLNKSKYSLVKRMVKKVINQCKNCEKRFETLPCKKRIFCSKSCKSKYQKSGQFFKGMRTWNKGLKGYMAGEKHHWFGRNNSGENNPTYKKDRTQLRKNEKKHLDGQYKDWMLKVKKRDNWKCKINNKNCKGRLEAHHILNWIDYPELRYDINNGITLCHAHHPRGRKVEAKLSPYFQNLVAEMK